MGRVAVDVYVPGMEPDEIRKLSAVLWIVIAVAAIAGVVLIAWLFIGMCNTFFPT